MRIIDLLNKDSIELNGEASNKKEAVDRMVELMQAAGNLNDIEAFKQSVLKREEEGTTGIGGGIAIPHGKSSAVDAPGLSAMLLPQGVDYQALDGAPTNIIFLIAAPDNEANVHLEVLSHLSMLLMNTEFLNQLRGAKSKDEFLEYISNAEQEKFGAKETPVEETKTSVRNAKLLGVTACPTGIAHTYMAAENLENKAREKGIMMKVETDGSGGVKNALTRQEIAEADCIIVAVDKNVEMARFDGKPVIITKVADGIHKADELIDRAMSGTVAVYHHAGGAKIQDDDDAESLGRKAYKHLMNGVSHMLPFVVGGGILIALAFLFDNYEINPANFGMNTPLAAFFKTVGGQAFGFMLPILAGFIAMSIGDRPGLAVGVVGGVLASGGYTFASLTDYSGQSAVSSGFLGALLAGFVGGYIIVILRKLFDKLPQALEGIKPVLLYPVCGILMMGLFIIAVNPAVGAINTGLNNFLASMGGTSKIIMGAILGGMMAVDMGGPFNKAAYVFGTAQLTVANAGPEQFQIMAAVMIGGMVPPIAIALCSTFFKQKFTENERKSGVVNYIMGLSFISEGAIPFAASDPLRVLPSCIIGSAIAGALSMAFGCGLRAPHGGIFVIGVISNPVMYLAALTAGSVVGALILAVLKKDIKK